MARGRYCHSRGPLGAAPGTSRAGLEMARDPPLPGTAQNGCFLLGIGPICAMWLIIGPRGLIFPLPAWGLGMGQILMSFKGETANSGSGALQGPIGPRIGRGGHSPWDGPKPGV